MRVKHLSLQNIGPFIEADMEFMTDADEKPPVVLITGENGTGKSIILDAIRAMFGPFFGGTLERQIRRKKISGKNEVKITLVIDQQNIILTDNDPEGNVAQYDFPQKIPHQVQSGSKPPNWIVDFWSSNSMGGSFAIKNFANPDHQKFLINSLSNVKTKANITQLICHFDYLRDSRDKQEKAVGERLFAILEQIFARSLMNGGRLSHISRATYEPIIIQNNQSVKLDNLSSGNLYLIQHLVDLLGKMYSLHFLRRANLEELCLSPGLLLIDEAENQLHPKWQKRLISTILEIFPNLQIIATTHSPFIISSVENPRLFVCKSRGDHCVVVDETAEYSNKPVDEILMSPLFEETLPFNEEISQLILKRKTAIQHNNQQEREHIEARLKKANPEYFAYLDVDNLLKEVTLEGMKL